MAKIERIFNRNQIDGVNFSLQTANFSTTQNIFNDKIKRWHRVFGEPFVLKAKTIDNCSNPLTSSIARSRTVYVQNEKKGSVTSNADRTKEPPCAISNCFGGIFRTRPPNWTHLKSNLALDFAKVFVRKIPPEKHDTSHAADLLTQKQVDQTGNSNWNGNETW